MFWPVILMISAVYKRMNGIKKAVMTVAGSGNQGLTITVPLTAIAKLKGVGREVLQKSVLFTSLTTVYMKGGSLEQIETAIKNTIASNAGMICDGAKTSCALKARSGISSALTNTTLALNGMPSISAGDGIISKTVEETAQNVGYLVNKGMASTDDSILDILIKNNI